MLAFNPYLTQAQIDAANAGIPVDVFTSLITAESGWNAGALSPTGAVGLGQVLPSTAQSPGFGVTAVNPSQLSDPNTNLAFSANYLRGLFNTFGNWSQALLAYNKGPAYAAQHPNETPYPQSGDIQNALSGVPASADAVSTLGSGATTGDTQGSAASGCTSFLSTPLACLSFSLSTFAYIVLGLLVFGAGLWMLKNG